jgi:hypothetical protein
MSKLKMLKYPKKPKQSASVVVKERWLKRCSDIDKENRKREGLNKKSENLSKKIASKRR